MINHFPCPDQQKTDSTLLDLISQRETLLHYVNNTPAISNDDLERGVREVDALTFAVSAANPRSLSEVIAQLTMLEADFLEDRDSFALNMMDKITLNTISHTIAFLKKEVQ